MKKKPKPRKRLNLDALLERQVLLYSLRDFRFGQMLNPEESAELAVEIGSNKLRGWSLRSVLASEEVGWFRDMRNNQMLITAKTIAPHRNLAVLSLQVRGVQFRWVIPMWEVGARDWLTQVIRERCFNWVLQSVESDEGALQFISNIEDDTATVLEKLLADAPTTHEDPKTLFNYLVQAGMLVMVDTPEVYGAESETTEDLRLLMMARKQNAHDIVMLFQQVSDEAQAQMGLCLTHLMGGGGTSLMQRRP